MRTFKISKIGIWFAAGFVLSLLLRLSLFYFESMDYTMDMSGWYDSIVEHGRILAWKESIGNYPPLYYYFLTVATCIPVPKLFGIKLVYVFFDYVIAFYTYRILRLRFTEGNLPLFGALAVLFLPTVVLNSSFWAQCDAMYTSALVATVYYFLKRSSMKALIAFGISFSLKPQAVFLSPLLLTLFLAHRFRFWQFFWIPWIYFTLAVPALLVGRPIDEILLLYVHQRITPRPELSLGATNLYQWLPDDDFSFFFMCGMIFAFLSAVLFVIAMRQFNPDGISDEKLVQAAFVCVVLMPYVLPAMHERYFFPADVFSLILAMYCLRRFYYVLVVQICSFFTYLPFLFNKEPIPRPFLALLMGIVLVLAIKDLFTGSRQPVVAVQT